jgi:hypothetical protein
MSMNNGRKLLGKLLVLAALTYGVLAVPPAPAKANYCEPPPSWWSCLELTCWNPATQQCECQDAECCAYYEGSGFTPNGCPR